MPMTVSPAYMGMPHVCVVSMEASENTGPHGTLIVGECKLSCECPELEPCRISKCPNH